MKRKNIYGVFDTECIGLDKRYVYDLGLTICSKDEILFSTHWIIEEVFNNDDLMSQAYYGSKKHSYYLPKIVTGNITPVSLRTARAEFNELLSYYEVNFITAYNLSFDMSVLRQSMEYSGIPAKKFLSYPLNYFDLWSASCETFFNHKIFSNMAESYQWKSQAGNYRTNAEVAFRYATFSPYFIESHTALEDSIIEAYILQYVLRQKKKFTKNDVLDSPWKIPNKR